MLPAASRSSPPAGTITPMDVETETLVANVEWAQTSINSDPASLPPVLYAALSIYTALKGGSRQERKWERPREAEDGVEQENRRETCSVPFGG
ncbi:hypothetical protein D4764_16G0004050 [Takifugu flavidus]|uniref:Uncharacterized protein n=1 Tax=Takifugu flavidus TaxID=433684 RepID=A0A5C6NYM1_9TELE|nr:hypothetical protein D4764_16G0004050 [Takifugu flavidus]